MNRDAFFEVLRQRKPQPGFGKEELQWLILEHPYFGTARILMALFLQQENHIRFDDSLKKAAAYAGDRSVLYRLFHPEQTDPGEPAVPDNEKETGKDKEQPQIAEPPSLSAEPSPGSKKKAAKRSPAGPEKKKRKKPVKRQAGKKKKASAPPAQNDMKSFAEWIRTYQAPPAAKKQVMPVEKKAKPASPHQLMDAFLREEPRITPKTEFFSAENMARKSTAEHDEFLTETLAKIYADQGHTEKAIGIYRKLSLKYPEKSGYFAGLIGKLQTKNND